MTQFQENAWVDEGWTEAQTEGKTHYFIGPLCLLPGVQKKD